MHRKRYCGLPMPWEVKEKSPQDQKVPEYGHLHMQGLGFELETLTTQAFVLTVLSHIGWGRRGHPVRALTKLERESMT